MESAAGLRAGFDALPVNVFMLDYDLNLLYMNPRAEKSLGSMAAEIRSAFHVELEDLIGGSILRIHPSPREFESVLRSRLNLPHEETVVFGNAALNWGINAMVGPDGSVMGYVMTWEEVGARKRKETELARDKSMLEQSPVNVMFADANFALRYLNPASLKTLRTLEQYLPAKADSLLGKSIDIFHKNPQHVRKLLSDPRNLPHKAEIQVGPEVLDLLVSAIYDSDRNYLGPMVTWELSTEKMNLEKQNREMAEREKREAAELQEKVGALLAAVDAAADGDLTHEIAVKGEDAVGRIGESLSRFLSDLRGSISVIAMNAKELNQASEHLTDVSQLLGHNAEKTSSQASVVSSASDEVSKSVQTVAAGSEETAASIKEIARSSAEAAKVASEAVKIAQGANVTISKLGTSSAEIGQVLKTITSIAEQTNLLALNATIEAARAGEAGKGFAVVANELKELAKETAKATEDIGKKIQAIQSDTQGAVGAIGQITGIIQQINDISNNIAGAVEEQSATTNEMGRSVGEAARGIAEIAQNIGGVAEAASSTGECAGETQKSAKKLLDITNELQKPVARFKYFDENKELFSWDQSYSVGVNEIDNQHKQIFSFINQLYKAMMKGQGKEAMGKILDALVDYTATHFAYEERLMTQTGYGGYDEHLDKHKKLVAQVLEFQGQYKKGMADVNYDLFDFLKGWLRNHIHGIDKKYSAHFNSRGIC
ncbi:MAG: bacteriohemerythrin [Nitrospinae bacterium]|nr:bacteriohemerythrin [Nitrospinota bacterium]